MKTITFNPEMIQKLNPTILQEAARQVALKEAARPKLNLLGFVGIAALGVAGVLLLRAR